MSWNRVAGPYRGRRAAGFWAIVWMCGIAWLAAASVGLADEQERPRRFIFNTDGNNMFIYKQPPMQPADVYTYVDEVANTKVTTLFASPNIGMVVSFPGTVSPMIASGATTEELERLKQVGREKNVSNERSIANLHGLVEAGHDPLGLVIERAREKGLEVFISFRLNEIHDVQNPDSLIVSKFWRDHPEWRVGKPDDQLDDLFREIIGGSPEHPVSPIVARWFTGALNFAIPEVRQRRLAELRECCQRYPIDGLDLDFQRFPIYFPQDEGREHVETMTSWVREVRQMTREIGEKRGRPLLLCARVLAKPQQNLAIGLDPCAWANAGLLDFLVVSHYLRNDFLLPIAEFRRQVPEEMPVYGSIEYEPQADSYRRIARQLYQSGADGVMMFNFVAARESGNGPPFEVLSELHDPSKIRLED